jgi:hypothetical protein
MLCHPGSNRRGRARFDVQRNHLSHVLRFGVVFDDCNTDWGSGVGPCSCHNVGRSCLEAPIILDVGFQLDSAFECPSDSFAMRQVAIKKRTNRVFQT